VQGDWMKGGDFVPATGSVTLSGSSRILIGATTFNDLTVNGSYDAFSDVTVNGAMSLSGAYQGGATTLTLAGDLVNTGSLSSSGTVTFTGTAAQAVALNAGFNSSGALNFDETVAPGFTGVSSPTLYNVNINNTASVPTKVGWVVNGPIVEGNGASFAAGAATHTFKSDFINNGFVSSSGSLVFSPSAPATLALGGSSFVSAGVVVFGGTGPITLQGGTPGLDTVVVANTHPAGLTPSANWVLSGDLVIDSDATLQGGNGLTFTVAGDWSDNGTFNGQNSTVTLTGAGDPLNGNLIAGIGSTTFNHLIIGGKVTAGGDFNVAGNFTNNGSFDGTGATVTFLGSTPSIVGGSSTPIPFSALTVAKSGATTVLAAGLTGLTDLSVASGTLDTAAFAITQDPLGGDLNVAAGASLRIGGANSLPAFTNENLDPASTVEYYGTSAQTIAPINYGNLTSSSTGPRILPSGGTIGIAGSFSPGSNAYTVAGSTVDYNGTGTQTIVAFNYFNLTNSSASPRVLGTDGVIGIAGTFTPGSGAYTTADSTLDFNGGNQTIPVFAYNNLVTSGSGTKTLGGNITVNGSLSLSSGTLNDAGFTATVNGNVENEATHTGTGKILLTNGSDEHELSGQGAYSTLELNDLQGAMLSLTNLTVNKTLIFTSGNITTTTNRVIIGPTGSVARSSGHVVGYLQKSVPTGAAVSDTFEIGDPAHYLPVSVIFTNVTTAGELIASATAGSHPDIENSGVSATRGVNRYWTVDNNGVLFTAYNALFNFSAGDVDPSANPTNFVVAKKHGAVWTRPAVSAQSATNILARGMTNFSDYVIGELAPTAPAISTPPQDQVVNIGGDAVFSVEATGTGSITYQWLFNGNPIAGATNHTLVITNVQSSDAGTYTVIVDNGSVTSTSAVLQVNQPPTLADIPNQTVDEENTLSVPTSAIDPEGGPLTYQLLQSPASATIDGNGVVTWTPPEDQGPNSYPFTVQVTDNGSPGLTAARSFTVTVDEVNRAPVFVPPISDRAGSVGTALSFTVTATDPDIPANILTFSLLNPPAGASIDPNTGAFHWTIPGPNSSTNHFTVVVTDNGSPIKNATQTFTVYGRISTAPGIVGIDLTSGHAVITFAGIPGEAYRVQATGDLAPPIDWSTVATAVAETTGLFQYMDHLEVKDVPMRIFRAVNP